jgi:hypothetical protein
MLAVDATAGVAGEAESASGPKPVLSLRERGCPQRIKLDVELFRTNGRRAIRDGSAKRVRD